MDESFLLRLIAQVSYFVLVVYIVNEQSANIYALSINIEEKIFDTHLYGLSLENCKQECDVRPRCHGIQYYRRGHKCSILQTAGLDVSTRWDRSGVQISKRDIKYVKVCNCSEYETCDPGSGSCTFKECPRFDGIANAVVLGNMGSTGARLKIKCDPGYRPEPYHDNTVCLQNGSWGNRPKCIKVTIGEKCQNGIDCKETNSVCIGRRCFCSSLYRYNGTNKDCVKVCDRLRNDFTAYPGVYISYLNIATTAPSVCGSACIENPRCFSYEYEIGESSVCRLNSVSYEMAIDADPGLIKTSDYSNLFSVNCE